MLSPINWIKPRLRSLCVIFGAADMTLVILSALCWFFVFNSAFKAQQIRSLYDSQRKAYDDFMGEEVDMKKFKEDRSDEELRLERTIRACGYSVDDQNQLDYESVAESNYAGPAALTGAAMGGFFILGALLTTLNSVDHPASRRMICAVALFGEGISSFFLFIGAAILATNDGVCQLEYYYENFAPILYLFVLTMIFIFTYKTYEVTVIAFYLGQQSTEAYKEHKAVENIRKSLSKRASLVSDIKRVKPQEPPPPGPSHNIPSHHGHQSLHHDNQARPKKHSYESGKSGGSTRGQQGDKEIPHSLPHDHHAKPKRQSHESERSGRSTKGKELHHDVGDPSHHENQRLPHDHHHHTPKRNSGDKESNADSTHRTSHKSRHHDLPDDHSRGRSHSITSLRSTGGTIDGHSQRSQRRHFRNVPEGHHHEGSEQRHKKHENGHTHDDHESAKGHHKHHKGHHDSHPHPEHESHSGKKRHSKDYTQDGHSSKGRRLSKTHDGHTRGHSHAHDHGHIRDHEGGGGDHERAISQQQHQHHQHHHPLHPTKKSHTPATGDKHNIDNFSATIRQDSALAKENSIDDFN